MVKGIRSDEGLTLETSSPPFLPYGGINYLINSFDYPYLLFQFPIDAAPVSFETISTIHQLNPDILILKEMTTKTTIQGNYAQSNEVTTLRNPLTPRVSFLTFDSTDRVKCEHSLENC